MKNHKFTTRTALLLTLLMLAPACLGACGGGQDEKTDSKDTALSEETAPEETGRNAISDNLPERDFGGKTFTALIPAWTSYLMVAEELTGEVLNDALYNRDRTVEERFNTQVMMHVVDDASSEMKNVVIAGDDLYQLAGNGIVQLGIDLMQDWYLDAAQIPYVDFSKPWYSQDVLDKLTYKDRVFIFCSDFSVAGMDMTQCMFYNRDLAKEYNLEEIYDVVLSGKWTMDRMESICKDIYVDVNGDGTRDEGDRYGLSMDFKGDPSTYLFNFGSTVLERQSDGTYKDVFYNEKLVNIVEWLHHLTHDEAAVNCENKWNHGYNIFMLGNTLIGDGRINMISWGMRESEIDYSIIPRPKYDEAQPKYLSTVAGSSDALVFLKTVGDREFAGILTEALSAVSYKTAVPAYYDNVLSYKLIRDEGNLAMVELIMEGRTYDFGYVYGAFESYGGGACFWINDIVMGNGDLTSYYQKRKSIWENYMASVYEKFDNYTE